MAYKDEDYEYMERFAANLRRMLYERGLGQSEASADFDIAISSYWRYTHGIGLPEIPVLLRMIDALDCTADDLLYPPPVNGRRK